MVTGSTDSGTIQAALQRGVDGYITKPYSIGRVLDTMERTLCKEST
jgi:AmiR/NasT family two-component response regulator